jgi:hypothetical protein
MLSGLAGERQRRLLRRGHAAVAEQSSKADQRVSAWHADSARPSFANCTAPGIFACPQPKLRRPSCSFMVGPVLRWWLFVQLACLQQALSLTLYLLPLATFNFPL